MTEDSNWRLSPEQFTSNSSDSAEQIVTLKLPADLARLIQTRSQQLGQSYTEVILALLQSALCTAHAEQTAAANATTLESLQTRLTALEAIIPRLVQLEGKWMAF